MASYLNDALTPLGLCTVCNEISNLIFNHQISYKLKTFSKKQKAPNFFTSTLQTKQSVSTFKLGCLTLLELYVDTLGRVLLSGGLCDLCAGQQLRERLAPVLNQTQT